MNLRTTLAALGIPDAEPVFAPDWERHLREIPQGSLPFLAPDCVATACRAAFIPEERTAEILAAARRVAADPAASALAWHCHAALFRPGEPRPRTGAWPMLTAALGRDAGLFYILVLLSGTPQAQAVHRARAIPPDIARETLRDLNLYCETEDYPLLTGDWGLSTRVLGGIMQHWRGDLYRLGRLQFVPGSFSNGLRAFRHRGSGAVVALSEEGVRYRADGQLQGTGGGEDRGGAWTATLALSDSEIRGHPIASWGCALRETVTLAAAEWQPALAPGDGVLHVHISGGSPMDYDSCGDSLRRALDFFPRYFPDRPFVGFCCRSWVLDNQFERLLPPSSNLVRFQQEVYLFPLLSGGAATIEAVFGFGLTPDDRERFPRRTRMQQAFARHLDAGGHFRSGGCFLLKEDLDWGSRRYRRLWPL
ncbi:MAG: DUF5596 domain-containing protein [Armatimonadetes bacterium]|nr:DUF5596 domain-containing protein [Armatimonadota bacterium]